MMHWVVTGVSNELEPQRMIGKIACGLGFKLDWFAVRRMPAGDFSRVKMVCLSIDSPVPLLDRMGVSGWERN